MSSDTRNGEQSQSEWLSELLRRIGGLPLALTKDQAAEQLSIGRTVLDRLIATGQIRVVYYEANGHPRILLEEVMRFLQERQRESSRMDRSSRAAHVVELAAKPRARTRRAAQQDAEAEIAKFDAAMKKRR